VKKSLYFLVSTALGFGLGYAGDDKDTVVIEPKDPVSFASGLEISPFAAGAFTENGDEFGGGIMLSHFFTESVGIDVSYAAFAFESEVHTITADLALRYPDSGAGISPYLVFGGGLRTNGSTDGIYRVGGGVDFRPNGLNNLGIFADGVYNFVEGDDGFTIARFGIRFPF
jgi:hypothetical protein